MDSLPILALNLGHFERGRQPAQQQYIFEGPIHWGILQHCPRHIAPQSPVSVNKGIRRLVTVLPLLSQFVGVT